MESKRVKQCSSCPWRVGCVPERDIPNYSLDLHKSLRNTIRSGLESMGKTRHIMSCHASRESHPFPCAGWLYNQLESGNNIGVRISVSNGTLPVPEIDGPQHETFEDTIPEESAE